MASFTRLDILWQSEDAVAVAKPAGLASIPGRAETDCVLQSLSRQLRLPDSGAFDPRLRVVHRLDKETSGVMLFAKNIEMQRHLSRQFRDNLVTKEYLALVSGKPLENEGEIDAPLARHPHSPQRMSIVTHGGRPAKTLWHVEQSFRFYTLLRVFPKTGKTHQIRVHLQSIGLPLAIDPLYHASPPGKEPGIFLSHFKRDYSPTHGEPERPLISRLTLHAQKLSFVDREGNVVNLECPPPKDFRATIKQLSRWAK